MIRQPDTVVLPDDSLLADVDRMTAALRERLVRELSSFADELKRGAAEERERAAKIASEADALKRALADERERAAQQAAEAAAADMRREAEMQSHLVRVQDETRRRIEDIQRAAAEELERAVQHAADAATADARRQADAEIAQVREAAQKQADEIRRNAEAQVADLRVTLQAQLDEVRRAALADVEEARRTGRAEAEEARRAAVAQVEEIQRRADEQIGEARREVAAQLEEVRRRAHQEIEQAQAGIERVRAEAEVALRAARADARAEAEEVLIAQLASAQADTEHKIHQAVDRTRTDAHQSELAYTARLADAIRRLDDARSLGEALDTLADCAARHVDRAAVLVLHRGTLRLRRSAGFSPPPDVVELDSASAGLAAMVVSAGAVVARGAIDPSDGPASGQPALPSFARDAGTRHAVGLPVTVGGRVVAVLYGDAPRTDAPSALSRWPATLEVLARHASRMLEALTVQQAAGLPVARPITRPARPVVPGPVEHAGTGEEDAARRYARLLVSEIRMYHEPLVDAGRRSRDLRLRLGGEIDRARRLYEERIPSTVRGRSDYFEQELVRTLADGDRSLLG